MSFRATSPRSMLLSCTPAGLVPTGNLFLKQDAHAAQMLDDAGAAHGGGGMIGQRSIRTKLLTIVMSTTLATLAVSVGTVVAYDLRGYQHALLNDLSTQAELIGH